MLVRRDNGKKESVSSESLIKHVQETLDDIQKSLFSRAKKFLEEHTFDVETESDFIKFARKGMVRAHWCGSVKCEEALNEKTGATIRCIPFEKTEKGKCVSCGAESTTIAYFARAY